MFSMQALDAAKNYGARAVLITGVRSPPIANTDFRLETCFQGNSEASISATPVIVRIIQWIGLFGRSFVEKFRATIKIMEEQIPFKIKNYASSWSTYELGDGSVKTMQKLSCLKL
jgi:hypothetical protein